MKLYVFHVKGEDKTVSVSGASLVDEQGYISVKNGDELILQFERNSLRGWHIEEKDDKDPG
jgi:hypothetical protein